MRADDHGGKRTVLIDGQDFIARFLQHVLPSGFKRIRHYGLLSPALKAQKLAAARAALAIPATDKQAREDAAAFLKRVAGIDVAEQFCDVTWQNATFKNFDNINMITIECISKKLLNTTCK